MTLDLVFHLLLVFSLAALFIGCAFLKDDWAHPAPMLAFLWLIVCSAYLLWPHHLFPLSMHTKVLVLAAVTAFCIGAGLSTRWLAPARNAASTQLGGQWRTTIFRPLLFWVALLGLPLFLLKAQDLAESASYTESFYVNLRIALTGELDDAQTFGALAYLIPVSFSSAFVELAASHRRWFEGRGWISLALASTYAVMATGRTYVFLLLITLAFIALIQKRATLAQIGLLAIGSATAAFIGLGMLANKIGVDSPNTYALTASDAVALYLLSGLTAFDYSTAQPANLEWGANMFRSLLAILSAIGIDVQVPPLVKPYVYIPEPTNVYTVFSPYFRDFGWLGVVLTFGALGSAQALLFQYAKSTLAPRAVIFASLSAYPLLMQFFQDQYFSLLTTWTTFALLISPCFALVPGQGSSMDEARGKAFELT